MGGLALGTSLAVAGCAEPVKDVDRTQPNALSKDLFKGTWYFARTVVDAPYETQDTFVGDRQEYLFKEDFPAFKIRWRIEEDYLMACRVDEVVVGSNSDGERTGDIEDVETGKPGVAAGVTAPEGAGEEDKQNGAYGADEKFPCRHPIAAFKIQGHFDIQRNYNSATGEQSNVLDENASDRPWFNRQYIRVDWTDIGLTEMGYNLGSANDIGWLRLQSPYYVQAEDGDCREIGADGKVSYANCEEGFLPPIIGDDAMLITNRVTIAPSSGLEACFYGSIPGYGGDPNCTLNEIGMRLSFMKVPEVPVEEQYAPKTYPDDHFERYGVWRVNKPTYLPGRGQTDFRQYLATRWNIYEKWRDKNGNPLAAPTGFKPIKYYLNREFPADLKPTAFKMAKEWSDAYAGVHTGINPVTDCKAVCGSGKPVEQCTASDENFRMEGKCPFELHENTGEQFLGDLRYSYIAFIQDASYGQPCGVGGPANDPETGEMINGVAYVYGNGCFDYLETRVLDMVDLLCAQHAAEGTPKAELPQACKTDPKCVAAGGSEAECTGISDEEFIRGRQILDIMQAQGYVQRVPQPIDSVVALANVNISAISDKLKPIEGKFEELRHHSGKLAAAAERLKGTPIERALIPDEMAMELTHGRARSSAELTDDEVAHLNPLQPGYGAMTRNSERIEHLASRAAEPAEFLFNDNGLWALARRNMNMSRAQFRQFLREEAFRAVTLHELGHNMGLRHNFIASFDRVNYFPEYWQIKKDVLQRFEEEEGRPFRPIDSRGRGEDETEEAFATRYKQWNDDMEKLRFMERDAGIKEYQYSSIMDYHAMYYGDWRGLGSYDKAAMRFLYSGLVDRIACEEKNPEDCDIRESARQRVQWYGGGQRCYADSDCPHAAHGQKCRENPAAGVTTCSSWDDDEVDSGRFSVRHKFCSDERVDDQPFCNRFDEGDSSEEIVRNMIEQYEDMYAFRAFRRHNSAFSINGYFRRIYDGFRQIGDQMQSMLYKYFNEPGFRSIEGPGGFDDMFRATVTGFDFLGSVLARPDTGNYKFDEDDQVYRWESEDLTAVPSDTSINIPLGQGKPMYSSYERGYFGELDRLAYVGSYYDKIAATLILTQRDFGTRSGNNEERFLLSFYDFFPKAFARLMGAHISGDRKGTGMAYDPESKTLYHRKYWDGSFFSPEAGLDPEKMELPGGEVEPRPTPTQQIENLYYAALFVPWYADPSFGEKLRIFELGGETGFDIDGAPGIDAVPADRLAIYQSPLTHRSFVAVETEEVGAISFRAVQRANVLLDRMQALIDDEAPQGLIDSAERDLRSQEDLLGQMVWLVDRLGISTL